MKKIFTLLTAIMLGMCVAQAQLVVKWGDPDNYTLTSDLVNGFGHSQYYSEKIYYWENASTTQFIRIEGVDRNKTSDMTNGNAICLFIKVTGTRTYSDGAGGTVVGPRVNTEGYPVVIPSFCRMCESEENSSGNSYYGTFSTEEDECTVGYYYVTNGYYEASASVCNLSSRFHESDGYDLYSITAGRVTVEEGKNGTMLVQYYNGNGALRCVIGEYVDGVITATSSDVNKGNVTGTIVGSNADFVTGTTYDGGTKILLNANALSEYTFLKWNEDSNTDNPRTITVNGNATYTAVFAPTRTITVTPDDASHGSTSGSGSYAEGATVDISASGLNGYVFSQWNDGSTDNPRTITVTGNDPYTAQFVLPGMTVVSCSNSADISFHCNYSDILQCGQIQSRYFVYYNGNGYTYANCRAIAARNSDNNGIQLYFTRRSDGYYSDYSGGECQSLSNAPTYDTYTIANPTVRNASAVCNDYWSIPSGNSVIKYNTASYVDYYNNCSSTDDYSYILYGGTEYKLGSGQITVSRNNASGIFIETNDNVLNFNGTYSIYFTLGNRNEYTATLGTGTMSVTPSSLTMSASNGNNSASIRLNNNTTGNKTLSDFSIANCSFVYNGTSITEISDMTGTLTASNGTYTLSLKIRDCSQNLYKVTMSAVAPSFELTWNSNGKSLVGGTEEGDVQFGTALTTPSSNTAGYTLTGWSPSVPSTMPAQDVEYTAQWSAINYSITYNQNSGTGATNGTYTVESSDITLPTASAMTKTGHTFDGWYDNSGFTGSAITTIPQGSTGNKTFWAKWTAKEYTVNLDNQSATTAGQESVTATYGQAMPTIATNLPAKTNCIFEGYYSAQSGGIKYYNADGTSAHIWDIDVNPTTLYAHWIHLYTITIADYTGGTVTVSPDGGTPFTSGSQDIADGTNITITASNAEHYTLTSLTYSDEGAISSGAEREVDGPHTVTAVFTGDSYDITYKDKDNADYSGYNLASLPATHTYGTATTLVNGAKEGYTFLGWFTDEACTESAGSTIGATAKTATFTLYAKWERNVVKYNVTFAAGEHGSASGKIGGNIITSGQQQEEGSTITLTATPDNFYSFVEWRNASNEQVVSTNAEYSFTLAEEVNLTAVFALQETIELTDNFENGSQWQDDYADLLDMLRTGSDKAGKAKQKDVQLNRTFAAERWSTFALPFGYSLSSNQTHPFYGHVYSLVSAQYEEKGGKGYLTLNCMPNTTSIKANTPYVLITDKDAPIANPVFNNVRLTEIEENTTTVVQDVNNTGSVRFVNTEYRQRIDKIEQYGVNSKENKSVIYLSGNKLYYPGGAIYQNAFRAYFVMNYSTIYHVAPRVRLVMPNGESVEQAEEETVETKKYIENGILVIERNGIKYDAQGHVIK